MKNNVNIEFQYFEGCPNSSALLENVKEAIKGLEEKVALKQIEVDTREKAKEYSFRGSPTLLINGKDFEGVEALKDPDLTCRVYSGGIPDAEEIRNRIKNILEEKQQ